MKKRILTWLLVLAMVMSCLPVTAMAAGATASAAATYTLVSEDFESAALGTYTLGSSSVFRKYSFGNSGEGANTYSLDVVEEGDNQVLKVVTDGYRPWIATNKKFSGDYTVEVKLKIGADVTGITSLRLRNIGIPVEEGSTVPSNWASVGNYADYELRFQADGSLSIFAAKHAADNSIEGANAYAYLYSNGAGYGTKATYEKDKWYTVKISVSDTEKTVWTELYDDQGALVGRRSLGCGVVLAGEVTIDMQYSGTRCFDDFTVAEGVAPTPYVFEDDYEDYTVGTFDAAVAAEHGYVWRTATGTPAAQIAADEDGNQFLRTTAQRYHLRMGAPVTDAWSLDFDLRASTMPTAGGSASVTDVLLGKYLGADDQLHEFYLRVNYKNQNIGIYGMPNSAATSYSMQNNLKNGTADFWIEEGKWYHFSISVIDERLTLTATDKTTDAQYTLNESIPGYKFVTGTNVAAKFPVMFDLQHADGVVDQDNVVLADIPAGKTVTSFKEDFSAYTADADLPIASGNKITKYMNSDTVVKGTKTIQVVEENGNKVLKVTATDASTEDISRVWLATEEKFSGSYTVQAKFKAESLHNVFSIRLPGVDLPTKAGGTADYELRIYPTYFGIFLNQIPADQKLSTDSATLAYLYNAAGKRVVSVDANTWYTVKVVVDAEKAAVRTELYDAAGTTLLGSRTMTGATFENLGTAVTIDHQTTKTAGGAEQVTLWDDITVSQSIAPNYIVSTGECENGSVSVNKHIANFGDVIEIDYQAENGYVLEKLYVNGTATTKTYFTLNEWMDNDVVVTADFAPIAAFEQNFDDLEVDAEVALADIGLARHLGTAADWTFTVAEGDSSNALKVAAASRCWVKTTTSYSGDYVIENRFMINEQSGAISPLRLQNVAVPSLGAASTWSASPYSASDLEVRVVLDGRIGLVTTGGHITANDEANSTVYYLTDADGEVVKVAKNAWYTYRVTVKNSDKTALIEVLDAAGKKIVEKTLTGILTVAPGPVGVDMTTAGTYYIDYLTVDEYVPHTHDYTAVVTDPTCTEGGYTTYTCSCGDSYIADKTEALGHTMEPVFGQDPTYDSVGWYDYEKCSICGHTEGYYEIPALTKPELYTITVDTEIVGGTLTVDPTEGEVGTTVTVTAEAAEGYELVSITVNGEAVEGNPYTFAIEGDTVVSATFKAVVVEEPKYTVTIAEGIKNGTVAVDVTEGEVGTTVTVTATPAAGTQAGKTYDLIAITVNGEVIEGNTFQIAEGENVVSAIFGKAMVTMNSLSLEGKVVINTTSQFVGFDNIDVAEKAGLLVWNTPVEKGFYDENAVVTGLEPAGSYNNGFGNLPEYKVEAKGIPAKEYADELYLCAYIEVAEGVYAFSDIKTYSVQTYCMNTINKATNPEALKQVCAQILHYGAAAQQYFNYKTDNLANDVTKIPKLADYPAGAYSESLLTELDPIPTTAFQQNSEAKRTMAGLVLSDAIIMKLTFAYNGDFDENAGGKAEMLVWRGVEGELTEENVTEKPKELKFTEVYDGKREFAAETDGIPAKEYGDTVYACAKFTDAEGNVTYSEVTSYSVETYAKNTIGNAGRAESLKELCRRMVVYGEAAASYFGK